MTGRDRKVGTRGPARPRTGEPPSLPSAVIDRRYNKLTIAECASKSRSILPQSPALNGFRKFLCVALASGALGAGPLRAEDLAARVIILANSDDPDSLRLAQYYAGRRAIPAE